MDDLFDELFVVSCHDCLWLGHQPELRLRPRVLPAGGQPPPHGEGIGGLGVEGFRFRDVWGSRFKARV